MVVPYTPYVSNRKATHRTDNQAFLFNIKRGYTERMSFLTRALRLRTSFVHDLNDQDIINTVHVPTDENRADHLTKVLLRLKLNAAMRLTALRDVTNTDAPDPNETNNDRD